MNGRCYAPLCAMVLLACGGGVEGGGTGGTAGTEPTAGSAGTTSAGGTPTAGSGGSATAGFGGAGTAGSGGAVGGAPDQPGYDLVFGCEPVIHHAEVIYWATPQAQFRPTAISGDGRVVVGGYNALPVYWNADVWFDSLSETQLVPERVSCDGTAVVLRDPYTDAVWHLLTGGGGGGEIIPASADTTSSPLVLSPDGKTVIANLDGLAQPGPYPTRWTESEGVESLDALKNTLVYRVGNASEWIIGADIRHIYRYEPEVGKRQPWPWPAGAFGIPPELVVSADGSAYAFRINNNASFAWVRNGQAVFVQCPNAYCTPVDISGTGKVVAAYGLESGLPRTFIHTDQGVRTLNQLLEQYGVDTAGRALVASAMSNDGQAFTGVAFDTETWEERPFYATLPADAYDWTEAPSDLPPR